MNKVTRRVLFAGEPGASLPATASTGPSRRGLGPLARREAPEAPDSPVIAPAKLPDASPAHVGPHPDDPSLPAVDALVVLTNRCAYGMRSGDWAQAQALGYQGWLEQQLNYTALDDSAIEAAIAANLPRVGYSAAQLLADARATGNNGAAFQELVAATLIRLLFSPRQLFETMVEFWGDHFNITAASVPEVFYKNVDDREVIRAHALGFFPDMLRASARSLAMLYYLDNVSNRASGPNENYARELLELHTMGVENGYTEEDIKEVARCFTGWTVSGAAFGVPMFSFVPSFHDTGSKTVLGNVIAAGGGISDGDTVLNILAAHPNTAGYIAQKLCIRFIGDAPQQSAIDAVKATYLATGGDIKAMLRTLFASAEFQSSYDRKLRRPLDFIIASLRVTDATLSGDYLRPISNRLQGLGQVPFRWGAPDGYPDAMSDWINTGASLARWNWVFALAEDRASAAIRINPLALAGSANTPTQLVDALALRLLKRNLAAADRDRLIAFAANGGAVDAVLGGSTLTSRIRELVGLLLSSPYFQYR